MPSKKDIKTRIKAVQNTQKVTKAMKLISTIKLKQLQNMLSGSRAYSEQLANLIGKTVKNIDFDKVNPQDLPVLLRKPKDDSTVCILAITSDRGLCGPYNAALMKALTQRVNVLKAQNKKVKLLVIGGKANSFAQRFLSDVEVIGKYVNLPVQPSAEQAAQIFSLLEEEFQKGSFSSLEILYSRFISMIKSEVTWSKLVPFDLNSQRAHEEIEKSEPVIIFEPAPLGIIFKLIPLYCQNQIYGAMVSGRASELAHRVNAMSAATDNATTLIGQLTLTYNKARQASITQEISEIVAGAESVK